MKNTNDRINHVQELEGRSTLLKTTLGVLYGNLATIVIVGIVYFNFIMFYDYVSMILWSIILAIGLQRSKNFIISCFEQENKFLHTLMETHGPVKILFSLVFLCIICNDRAVVMVFLFTVITIIAGNIYVAKKRIRCGFSYVALSSLILLLGALAVLVLVAAFFFLKCTEESKEVFSKITEWANTVAAEEDSDSVNKLWLQVYSIMEMKQVQENIKKVEYFIWDSLKSLAVWGVTKEVLLECYNKHDKNVYFTIHCVWGDTGLSMGEVMQTLVEDLRTLNLTDIALQGGVNLLGTIAKIATFMLSFLGFFLTRGSEVVTCIVMLWYLLTSRHNWLIKGISFFMPMVSSKKHHQIAHYLARIVEAALVYPIQLAFVRGLVMWTVLGLLELPFYHFATLLVAATAFIPLFFPVLTLSPWILRDILISRQNEWTLCTRLFGIHVCLLWRGVIVLATVLVVLPQLETTMDADIYKMTHPYATSLAIYAGFSFFGISGIILGPILMLLLGIIYAMHDDVDANIEETPGAPPPPRINKNVPAPPGVPPPPRINKNVPAPPARGNLGKGKGRRARRRRKK